MKNFESISYTKVGEEKFKMVEMSPESKEHGYDSTYLIYNISSRIEDKLNSDLPWYEKYIDLLPYASSDGFMTLGEGNTPLINSKVHSGLYIKNEAVNPSGCYKDRESAVLMQYLLEQSIDKVALVSSGNAALSVSLYGQIYKIAVKCVVPSETSQGKKDLIRLFGGKLFEIDGIYEDCHYKLMEILEEDEKNVSVGLNPFRDQGDKVIAYELCEELGDDIDYIIVPTANGALISGIYQGYAEMKKIGKIKTIPKLIAVQVQDADPIRVAIESGISHTKLDDIEDSLAEGIIAAECFASHKAVDAIQATHGKVISVSEEEIINGTAYALQEEGIISEFTSGSAFAAFLKGKNEGYFTNDCKVVIINTGSGLKSLNSLTKNILDR